MGSNFVGHGCLFLAVFLPGQDVVHGGIHGVDLQRLGDVGVHTCLKAGMDAHIPKPLEIDTVYATMNDILTRQKNSEK